MKKLIVVWCLIWMMVLLVVQGFQFKRVSVQLSTLTINTLATYTFLVERNYYSDLTSTPWQTQLVPGGSNIVIEFSSDFTSIGNPSCQSVVINLINITSFNCVVVNRNLTISNAIPSSLGISTIQIILNNVLNPSPAVSLGVFIVHVGTDSSADQAIGNKLQPSTFKECVVYFDSGVVNRTGRMVFELEPRNSIPAAGSIVVEFPITLQWKNDISTNNLLPIDGTLSCSQLTSNVLTGITCLGDSSEFIVTASKMFSSNITDPFSFRINNLFAPPTTQPADTITIYSYLGNYIIDTCSTSITRLKAQTMNPNITSTSTMLVNSLVGLRFEFTLTDTINRNDYFFIQFPLGTTITLGSFSGNFSLTGSYNSSSAQLNLTQSISSATRFATQTLSFIFVNYLAPPSIRTTDSITLKVMRNGYEKMSGTSTITAVAKNYTSTFSALNTTINTITSYTLFLTLADTLQSTGFIVVSVPTSLTINNASFSVSLSGTSNIKTSPTFSFSNRTITITNMANTVSTIPSQSLNITINGLINPTSVQNISSFSFRVYYTNDFVDLVANGITNNSFQLTFANIDASSASVTPSNLFNLASNVTYSITFIPTNLIPINGYVLIQFPVQITLPSSLSTCSIIINSVESNVVCSISNRTVRVVMSVLIPSSTLLTIKVPQCINPLSTSPTNRFGLDTFTSTNARIDSLSTTLGPFTMTSQPSVYSGVGVVPSSVKNSDTAIYTFTIRHLQAIQNLSIVQITFPIEVTPPTAIILCLNEVDRVLSCSNIGNNTLSVVLNSTSTLANYSNVIKISGVINPPSLETTSNFVITSLTSNNLYKYAKNTTLQIKNTIVSQFQALSYTFAGRILNQSTTLSVTFDLRQTTHSLIFNISTLLKISTLTCTSSQFSPQLARNGTLITIRNFPNALPSSFTLTFTGLTAPATTTAGFTTVRSYNANGFGISQSLTTLIWTLSCNLPCRTCLQTNISSCLSCYGSSLNTKVYFYNNQCYETCPATTINDIASLTCKQCLDPCSNCQNTITNCTTCITPYFLYQNQCIDTCPSGYFGFLSKCQVCSSNCRTCSSLSVCLSCTPPLRLYQSSCQSSCPVTHSVIINNTCTQCSTSLCSNCTSSDICLACISPIIYFNFTCIGECPQNYRYNGSMCVTISQYVDNVLDTVLTSPSSITLLAFPFTIAGIVLFVACLISKLQNSNTYLIGITYSLFGVLQSLSVIYLLYSYYKQSNANQLTLLLIAIVIGIIFILNIVGWIVQSCLLSYDEKFSAWKQVCCRHCFYLGCSCVSLAINYKFKLIIFTRLFGFGCFRAQLQNVIKFRMFNVFSFIGIVHEALMIYIIIISLTTATNKPSWALTFVFIDTLIIAVINILLSLAVSRKQDNFFEEIDDNGIPMNKKIKVQDQSIGQAPLDFTYQAQNIYHGDKNLESQSIIYQQDEESLSLSYSQNRGEGNYFQGSTKFDRNAVANQIFQAQDDTTKYQQKDLFQTQSNINRQNQRLEEEKKKQEIQRREQEEKKKQEIQRREQEEKKKQEIQRREQEQKRRIQQENRIREEQLNRIREKQEKRKQQEQRLKKQNQQRIQRQIKLREEKLKIQQQQRQRQEQQNQRQIQRDRIQTQLRIQNQFKQKQEEQRKKQREIELNLAKKRQEYRLKKQYEQLLRQQKQLKDPDENLDIENDKVDGHIDGQQQKPLSSDRIIIQNSRSIREDSKIDDAEVSEEDLTRNMFSSPLLNDLVKASEENQTQILFSQVDALNNHSSSNQRKSKQNFTNQFYKKDKTTPTPSYEQNYEAESSDINQINGERLKYSPIQRDNNQEDQNLYRDNNQQDQSIDRDKNQQGIQRNKDSKNLNIYRDKNQQDQSIDRDKHQQGFLIHRNKNQKDQNLRKDKHQQGFPVDTNKNEDDQSINLSVSEVAKHESNEQSIKNGLRDEFDQFVDKSLDNSKDNKFIEIGLSENTIPIKKRRKISPIINKNQPQLAEFTDEYDDKIQKQPEESGQSQYQEIIYHPIQSKVRPSQDLIDIIKKRPVNQQRYDQNSVDQIASTMKIPNYQRNDQIESRQETQRVINERPPRPSTSNPSQLYYAGLRQLNKEKFNDTKNRQNTGGNEEDYIQIKHNKKTQNNKNQFRKSITNPNIIMKGIPTDDRFQREDIQFKNIDIEPSKSNTNILLDNTQEGQRRSKEKKSTIKSQYQIKEENQGEDYNPKMNQDHEGGNLRDYYKKDITQKQSSLSKSHSRQKSKVKSKQKIESPSKRQVALEKIYLQRIDFKKK